MSRNRHTVTIIDSDDGKYIRSQIIQLREGDVYTFPDGRRMRVEHVTNSGIDTELYQGSNYWFKVRIDNIELF